MSHDPRRADKRDCNTIATLCALTVSLELAQRSWPGPLRVTRASPIVNPVTRGTEN
jgi:hypothetical protein